MQFIEGQGLDTVLRELRRLRGNPRIVAAARTTFGTSDDSAAPDLPLTACLAGALHTGLQQAAPTRPAGSPDGREPPLPNMPEGPTAVAPDPTAAQPASSSTLSTQSDYQYYRGVARLALQAAEALAYAHGQKVLHRDVKPGNLLVDLRGTLWVTDFGLAKEAGDDLTRPGAVVGTLRYMAPERFGGTADARSDVYSLGATLYELLTFRPAFEETDQNRLVHRVLHEEPPRPSQVDARVPRDLETVCLKAMAKEPARRYGTAQELADDLDRFLADRPIKARRSSPAERAWRWCRRNPVVASLTAAVIALVAAFAGLVLLDNHRLRQEKDATRRQLYESLVAQARATRLSRRIGQRFESLKVLEEAAGIARQLNLPEEELLELRNEVIACLALPDLRVTREWGGWPEGSAHLDFDGALARYVRTDHRGTVSVRRVADDQLLWQFDSGLGNAWPRLSPDGRFLTLSDPPRFELWRVDERQPVEPPTGVLCTAHDFSPDGRRLATVQADGAIALYDLASGRCVGRLSPGPCPVHSAAFHPDNRRLAVSHAGGVQVRDLTTGAVERDFLLAGAEHVAWHPDGKTLAAVGGDRRIHLWDTTTGQESEPLWRWKSGELRITFNCSGDLLASYGREQMLRLWEPRLGSELFHTPASFTGTALRFGNDRLLAAGIQDDRLCLWEIVAGHECRRLIRNPARGEAPHGPFSVSPDGRFLAVRTHDGFGLWDRHTGAPLAPVPIGPLDDIVFEPSGTLLTAGPAGVFRWAIRPDPDTAGVLRLGPPRQLPLPPTRGTQLACSRDGRAVAVAQCWGALVLRADRPDQPARLDPHRGAQTVALSRDGRWAATGSKDGAGVRVWDTRTGVSVKDLLPQESWVAVDFSPDGRWLAARGSGLRLWSVGTWQEGPSLGGIAGAAFAFSPTEKLLAMETGYGTVRLLDPDTGREYARLAEPDQVKVTWICFSPDGQELLTSGAGNDAWIRVWDLRSIRQQLAVMDLDWGLPPYPPPKDGKDVPAIQVMVDSGTPLSTKP
jgi:WD40 repeat protein